MIANDHPLFRGGVVRALDKAPDMEVVGGGADAAKAEALVERFMPDLICLNISRPGGGIEAARHIGARFPAMRMVMLTMPEEDDDVLTALEAAASGYVLKGVGAEELIGVLRGEARGEAYVSPSRAARVLAAMRKPAGAAPADPLADLTKREEQILRGVARRLSNTQIGRELDIPEKTVKRYMTNVSQKLHVRNRGEAAVLAREHGI